LQARGDPCCPKPAVRDPKKCLVFTAASNASLAEAPHGGRQSPISVAAICFLADAAEN